MHIHFYARDISSIRVSSTSEIVHLIVAVTKNPAEKLVGQNRSDVTLEIGPVDHSPFSSQQKINKCICNFIGNTIFDLLRGGVLFPKVEMS